MALSTSAGVATGVAVAVGLVACVAAVGYATGRGGVEHARYAVLRAVRARAGGGIGIAFELRRYEPAIAAVTLVPGNGGSEDMRSMTSRGFRTVAAYIFGGNAARDATRRATPVAMTAPVVCEPVPGGGGGGGGRNISMTTPVTLTSTAGGDLEVSFIMPSKYARVEELPEPLARGVLLRELPARLEAVHAFSGSLPNEPAVQALARRLLEAMRDDGLAPAPGGVDVDGQRVALRVYAYDPPWVLPIFRLNEIAITVSDDTAPAT
jgi:hypothetical protein